MNAPTKDEVLEEARELDIEGRSTMDKEELVEAVEEAKGGSAPERDPRRPADEATNPKTGAVPTAEQQPGVTGPVNPVRDERSGPTPTRSASRIGSAQKRQKALRQESVSS